MPWIPWPLRVKLMAIQTQDRSVMVTSSSLWTHCLLAQQLPGCCIWGTITDCPGAHAKLAPVAGCSRVPIKFNVLSSTKLSVQLCLNTSTRFANLEGKTREKEKSKMETGGVYPEISRKLRNKFPNCVGSCWDTVLGACKRSVRGLADRHQTREYTFTSDHPGVFENVDIFPLHPVVCNSRWRKCDVFEVYLLTIPQALRPRFLRRFWLEISPNEPPGADW